MTSSCSSIKLIAPSPGANAVNLLPLLINDIFTSQELNTKVLNIAKKIATKSKHTLKVGKDAFYKQKEMKIEDAYKYASSVMVDNILNDDAEEGIEAFIEKRKPIWKN